ncbi:hypothetical protein OCU_11850 [Mycobacterium intracellulare ATCC 13950]|uniref:Uncharacterized protein n=1 Tax=Mycobacterium intracellulare (strain ATCC 13950 / DSM 43223 / JCM 6384 / NCTC 13025 / 3600) TaxID=487521 RepID=H8IWC1_MYCIA|nr:hypothetical protein OCU_11850 [Mycobacterium intracellulare ATCC 13950]AFC52704.1 hypothetical protein OCQ_11920 [Mycobacterium paraintracellulare]
MDGYFTAVSAAPPVNFFMPPVTVPVPHRFKFVFASRGPRARSSG